MQNLSIRSSQKIAFNFLCEKSIKDEFLLIAKEQDTSASKLFRAWIKEYIKKNKSDKNG